MIVVSRRSRRLGACARTFGNNHYAHYYRCMQRLPTALVLVSLALLCLPVSGSGHSGGTDSAGGHYCWTNCAASGLAYGQYHFHGGSTYTPPASNGGSQSGDPVYGWRVRSPSGNIQCSYASGEIACTSKILGKTAFLTRDGRAWVRRGVLRTNGGPVVPYGGTWLPDNPNFSWGCTSDPDGFICISGSRYFWVSKSWVRTGYK